MNIFQNIIIGLGALISGFFGGAQHFGNIALTSLSGADRQNTFPTTYNANNTAINNGKIDVGTTSVASITTLASLATVGTIGTGVWQGTAVGVQYGGTGSTTLSSNQILLGNGTSLVKTVSGWGNSGQSLVSNGTTLAPTWQSISFDQTGTYNLTGPWTFATSTTYIGNFGKLTATTSAALPAAVNIAGVSYTYPSSQGASGQLLTNNGSGVLSWSSATPHYQFYDGSGSANVTQTGTGTTYSTSTQTISIPAGVLTASSTITLFGTATCSNSGVGISQTFELRTSAGAALANHSIGTCSGTLNFSGMVFNLGSASAQQFYIQSTFGSTQSQSAGTAAVNTAAALTLVFVSKVQSVSGNNGTLQMSNVVLSITP